MISKLIAIVKNALDMNQGYNFSEFPYVEEITPREYILFVKQQSAFMSELGTEIISATDIDNFSNIRKKRHGWFY